MDADKAKAGISTRRRGDAEKTRTRIMRLRAISCLIVGSALLVSCATAQSGPRHKRISYQKIEFRGEVKRGEDFRRPFGRDLMFWLSPNPDETGWTIEVCEIVETFCWNDFVWMVSPPFRSYNDRLLDTTYGFTATQAIERSPREFRFVLRREDYDRARWLHQQLNESRPPDERPLDEAEREHYHNDRMRLIAHAGKGTLWITGSTIKDGKIESLKFRVRLEVPKNIR